MLHVTISCWSSFSSELCFFYSALSTSIVGAMTEIAVGSIIDKIISDCYDYLKDQVGWPTGMKKEELERLREYHPKIQAVVHFASSQEQIRYQNPSLNEWLWQLRDAIDGAHDVLDDHEWLKHEKQLTKNTEETKKKKFMSNLFESPRKILKFGQRVLKGDPNLKRLEDAVQKLAKVSADVTTFLPLLNSAKEEQKEQEVDFYKTRKTGSLPKNDLFGRREEKKHVLEWLSNPSNDYQTTLYVNISLLSIVGHGGMGKTTLLQHVYIDEITNEFDLKMWVCVSNNFDVKEVIADMLESLEISRPPFDSLDALQKTERPHLETLQALQNRLMIAVRSKKFLLILDDIWEEEENRDISKWEDVLAPLASGGFGSKIMVTTRMDSVAKMIEKAIKKKTVIFPLKGLKEEDCLELLKSHAFSGVENANDHNIIRDIVKKLSGYPLAAKVIGGVIKSNLDKGRWMTILERNSSITSLGENYIYSILKPSYISLSNPLRNCFAFCCLFPQDHSFDKDGLVQMWIALGFIQPPHDQEDTMEDIGGRYFDDLVNKSFFYYEEGLGCYKMHVLFHEMASKISAQECSKVLDYEKPSLEISKTVRHLYVQTLNTDILRKIKKLKYLHSLFLSYEASNQDFCNALIEILKASRSLRLLHICTPRSLEMIPDDIGNLKHLRYLKIDGRNLTMMPISVRNLYHLQYIIYEGPPCFSHPKLDDFLPRDINNLSNLRYLTLPLNYISWIHEIGKLKSLQELDVFDFRNENGYRIGELKNMNDLHKLRINHLENVDVQEAHSANLRDKRRLTDLILHWNFTNSRNNDLDENVLENLQPQDCLRNLSIRNYMGARSANWMMDVDPVRKLVKIELINCEKWKTLPPFGQLPFLKSLQLCNMPKVKLLESRFSGNGECRVFQSLEVLRIERLEALEDWFEAGVAVENVFPSLIELVLKDCPQLKELPSLPPKLENLQIEKTGWTTLNFCSNSNPIPLETLKVSNCQNITSLYLADETARLAALRYLTITNCPNLISLGRYREVETTNNCHLVLSSLNISDPSVLLMEPLSRSIASLEMLSIVENDELVSFSNEAEQWFLRVCPSLSTLELAKLKSLQSLPYSLESLSSVQKLSIHDVPMLRELPNLPRSLKSLSICGCNPELKKRYLKGVGSDWHKIDRIPRILIL